MARHFDKAFIVFQVVFNHDGTRLQLSFRLAIFGNPGALRLQNGRDSLLLQTDERTLSAAQLRANSVDEGVEFLDVAFCIADQGNFAPVIPTLLGFAKQHRRQNSAKNPPVSLAKQQFVGYLLVKITHLMSKLVVKAGRTCPIDLLEDDIEQVSHQTVSAQQVAAAFLAIGLKRAVLGKIRACCHVFLLFRASNLLRSNGFMIVLHRLKDGMMISNSKENYISEATPERIRQRYAALMKQAHERDFGELDEDVVIIDTETTGVSFKGDELTQVAAARMRKGEVTDWYVTFVNPGKPIPEDISYLTHIYDSDVAKAPTPAEALAGLVDFVGSSDLVAHNAAFDRHFCTRHPEGASLARNIWIDSLDLARIAVPRLKSHRLIDLVKAFDAPLSTHRADDDVVALCAVYRILVAAVLAMPAALVSYIAKSATREEWPTVKVFQCASKVMGECTYSFSLRDIRHQHVGVGKATVKTDADVLAGDPVRGLRFPDASAIEEAFSRGGAVGNMYDTYEPRTEQIQMAKAVCDAFSSSVNLAVEAGTGVGKSMAYLVPSILTAQVNNISVGVATKTNALLDQLVNYELPLLREQYEGMTFCSLKGFPHYPCLRMIERIMIAGPRMREVNGVEVSQAPALAAMLSFIEQSDYDDIDGMKIDYRALPRYEFTTNSHDCLRRKCPFFGSRCFVHGARQRAESSDIVVTNQTMLFCDVAAEGGLLPPIRYWVVDEAHGAEDEARRAFSRELSVDEILRMAARVSSAEASRNILLRAERQMAGKLDDATPGSLTAPALVGGASGQESPLQGGGETLFFVLLERAKKAGTAFDLAAREFCKQVHDLMFFDTLRHGKGYDWVDVWINEDVRNSYTFAALRDQGHMAYDAAEKLVKSCQELVGFMEGVEGVAAAQRDIASTAVFLKDMMSALELIMFAGPEAYAYAAHLSRKNSGGEKLQALMMNVGQTMNEEFYARTHSMVFTSATMTIADSFDTFISALGLGQSEFSAARTCQLDSSYDFDANMAVYVATDMPEPNDGAYLDKLEELLIGVHRAQHGSTLSLFTNRRDMEKAYSTVRDAVRGDDLRIVCQKWGISTKGLRDDFLADEHLSLFALKSFWEGFDAPGATLKTVVIPKLPFNKPTDPLSCERARMDAQAWQHYVLPAAVLETKQAAGRLIRSSTDRGNLVLADRRLVSKGYGKTFLRSLPSANVKKMTIEEIIGELELDYEKYTGSSSQIS